MTHRFEFDLQTPFPKMEAVMPMYLQQHNNIVKKADSLSF